jgi:hypothetical protein
LLGLVVFSHAEQWPYLYLELVPTMGIFAGWALYRSLEFLATKTRLSLLWLLPFLLIVLPVISRTSEHLEQQSLQSYQLATMEWVEAITKPEDSVFDAAGLVVSRPRSYRDFILPCQIAYRKGLLPDIV